MDGADLELFERSLRHATDQHTGADLDAALDDLGWSDALALDPRVAVSALFELQGAANVTSSTLDVVVRRALGLDPTPTTAPAAPTSPAIVLPAIGQWSPPGAVVGDRLTVRAGIGTATVDTSESAAVVSTIDGRDIIVLVPTNLLTRRRITGADPDLGLFEVRAEAISIVSASHGTAPWPEAVRLAHLALGHELVGAARAMLELARVHALERIQFGQPIGLFQAVRHRLADTLVAIETADAALDAGWRDPTPHTAAMAKAIAGRSARTASRHCQQVLAGIGFTTEHSLHRYVRRVLVLDELFGSARSLTKHLGDELLTTRRLPPLLPL